MGEWSMALGGRTCLLFVLVLDALPARAQVSSTPILACSSNSISIDVSSKTGFRFTPVESLPKFGKELIEKKDFEFDKGPFRSAAIYVASHGPEDGPWGRGVGAPFQV